jgi:hypothetical protein
MSTIRIECDEAGTCDVPAVFADELRKQLAALDWARVWASRPELAAVELEAAADAAENVARIARQYAAKARAADSSRCGCPDDCGCRRSWRVNYCGCKAHAR